MKSKISSLNYTNYVANEQLAKDNATLAFGNAIGAPMDLNLPNEVNGGRAFGICAVETTLTIGQANSAASLFDAPINKACRSLYTKYWGKNSSVSNFQEMDVGIYTFCSAQLVGIVSWLKTIYAACYMHNINSEYVRSGILSALGVSASDITKHVNDLRGYINDRIMALKNYALDSGVPLYAMMADTYGYILMDAPNVSKTQYYVKRPGLVMKYVKSGENIGSVTYVDFGHRTNAYLTFEKLVTLVNDVFSAFETSYYISSISAAIEKAVPNSLYQMSFVSEDYRITPFFDEVALLQIKNAVRYPSCEVSDITQDVVNRLLKQTLTVKFSKSNTADSVSWCRFIASNPVIHCKDRENSTPQDVVVVAAMTVGVSDATFNGTQITGELSAYGIEVMTDSVAYGYDAEETMTSYSAPTFVVISVTDSMTKDIAESIAIMTKSIREFDFFPNTRIAVEYSTSAPPVTAYAADVDWSIAVTTETLRKIHRSAVYAALGVPESA